MNTYTETPEMMKYRIALEFRDALREALQGREPSETERSRLIEARSMIIKTSLNLTIDEMKAVRDNR